MNTNPNSFSSNEQSEDTPAGVARRVLERIESERLTPRPRWEFILGKNVFWALGVLAVLLGALAFSAALFEIVDTGWSFLPPPPSDIGSDILRAAPFLFALALIIFIAFGYYIIRATRRGYRYPLWLIVLGTVLTSITIGVALFSFGLGQAVEEGIGDHPPFYRPIRIQQELWCERIVAPERSEECKGIRPYGALRALRGE